MSQGNTTNPIPTGPSPVGIWFKRTFSPSIDPGVILADEKSALEIERVHGGSPILERLLLWRRAALFVGLCFLGPAILLQIINTFVAMGEGGATGEIAGLQFFVVLANVGLGFAVFSAFRRWDRWLASRRVLFWTWLIAFTVPFLIALVPMTSFFRQGFGAPELALIGSLGALNAMLSLAPKALSLVPGLLRAAMVTKALFPGASAPGWLILMGTPFYMLLLFIVLIMPYQVAGGGLLALAIFAFLGAPVFLIRAGRRLATPLESEEALHIIRSTKTATLLLNIAGALFLFIGLIDIISAAKLSPFDTFVPLVQVLANVFVLSVIGTDATISALMRAHVSRETPEQAALRFVYDDQMSGLIRAQEELDQLAAEVASPTGPAGTGTRTSVGLPAITANPTQDNPAKKP